MSERSERTIVAEGIEATWESLVTVGLLGTDRRDPPDLPPGPLADLVADALDPTPSARLLTAVAATTVARRAGLTAGPVRPPLAGPDHDPRPMLPARAARRWRRVVADWPVLEAEWIAVAQRNGWRPSPDVLVAMLQRTRRSAALRGVVTTFGGPLAAWLVDQLPELAPPPGARAVAGDERALAVAPELRGALALGGAAFAAAVAEGLLGGEFRWAHRGVLLSTIAAVDPAILPDLLRALADGRREQEDRVAHGQPAPVPLGLWESLIELADIRRSMLDELTPPGAAP